jgi:ubiquinone/menaquinone biosynthesis C-methylase UbiE
MKNEANPFVCPAELSGSLDNSLRRWLQNPQKILKPYINKGMTILDLGCGPGFFTLEIAKLLNGTGKVIAADIQEKMLKKVAGKIYGTELEQRIALHKCQETSIGLTEKADFILAFWMVHEVPHHERLFEELKSILNPGGKIFIAEPKIHVTSSAFEKMIVYINRAGFEIICRPKVLFSRALLLEHTKTRL